MKKNLFCVLLFLLLAACHSGSGTNFEGTYGFLDNGKISPLLRVKQTDHGYVFFQNQGDQWQQIDDPAKPMTKYDLEALTKHPVTVSVDGLKTSSFALVLVPKGWSDGDFKTSTGYFAATVLGPVELQKISNGND